MARRHWVARMERTLDKWPRRDEDVTLKKAIQSALIPVTLATLVLATLHRTCSTVV